MLIAITRKLAQCLQNFPRSKTPKERSQQDAQTDTTRHNTPGSPRYVEASSSDTVLTQHVILDLSASLYLSPLHIYMDITTA